MHQRRIDWERQPLLSNPDIEGEKNEADNASMMEDRGCYVSTFMPSPFSASISGPNFLEIGDIGNWCASLISCSNPQSIIWETSINGFSYSFAGSGSCYSKEITSESLFIRVTVSCNNQVATAFMLVHGENPNDDPKKRIDGIKGDSLENEEDTLTNKLIVVKNTKLYLHISPNPTSTELRCIVQSDATIGEVIKVKLFDLKGNAILEKNVIIENKGQLNVALPIPEGLKGIYFLHAAYGEFEKTTKKVIIHE
jgi:hypothetical protein